MDRKAASRGHLVCEVSVGVICIGWAACVVLGAGFLGFAASELVVAPAAAAAPSFGADLAAAVFGLPSPNAGFGSPDAAFGLASPAAASVGVWLAAGVEIFGLAAVDAALAFGFGSVAAVCVPGFR